MVMLYSALTTFAAVLLVHGQSNFQLSYIAEQMNSYCNMREAPENSQTRPQNMPPPRIGKAGPAGPPGPRGNPGVMNHEKVTTIIQEKVNALQRDIAALKQDSALLARLKGVLCPVEYKDTCYWIIHHDLTAIESRKLCKAIGGQAANIIDSIHLEKLSRYLESITKQGDFWTGMDYHFNPDSFQQSVSLHGLFGRRQHAGQFPMSGQPGQASSGYIKMSDGSRSTFEQWISSYPSKNSKSTAILIRATTAKQRMGLWNYYPDKTKEGVVCEI